MKKTILFIMVFALGLYNTAIAQEISSYVEITLTPEGKTTPNNKVTLIEGTSFTSATTDGDVTKIKMNHDEYAANVDVYAILSDVKYAMVATSVDDLNDRYIGVQASSDYSNYVFTFNVQKMGRTMYLEDTKEHKLILLTSTTEPYKFSLTANEKVENRFRIYRPDTGDLEVCHENGKLVIKNNPYMTSNIIVKNEDGEVLNVAPTSTPQEISLESLTAGRYTVEFNDGEKKYIIAVKPTLEPTVK